MGERDSGTKGTELRFGVWRRGRWDWAYRFATPHGGYVFGCGFSTREQARETMQRAKERLGLK